MKEVWRNISGVPHYQISSKGRVRSLTRRVTTVDGQKRTYRGKIFHPGAGEYGHLKVLLPNGLGAKTVRYVHGLVAEAFLGPRPIGCQVAHNDGDASNNDVSNLRYATPVENNRDKIAHGTHLFGDHHPAAKLSCFDVDEIRYRLAVGDRQKDLAEYFGVTRTTISAISTGRSWSFAQHHDGPRFIGPMLKEAA